jgi:hypothetical protein
MIDIHPPQTSDHTWKDFCIHIGTIAVGILIPIGLELTALGTELRCFGSNVDEHFVGVLS